MGTHLIPLPIPTFGHVLTPISINLLLKFHLLVFLPYPKQAKSL